MRYLLSKLIYSPHLVRVRSNIFFILAFLIAAGSVHAATALHELTTVSDSTGAVSDEFGVSVAISGDTVVVGADGDDNEGREAGSAFIFQQSQGGNLTWGQVARLSASDAEAYNYFGMSVDIDADTVVVGAPSAPFQTTQTGVVYVFERNLGGNNSWGEAVRITAPAGNAGDNFGAAVAVDGDLILVSSLGADDVDPSNTHCDSGKAFIFGRDQGGAGAWGLVATLTGSTVACGHAFGWSVALQAGLAVVGTNGQGAYLFEAGTSGSWSQIKHFSIPAGLGQSDDYGQSVAVWGSTVMIGAAEEDDTCGAGASPSCYFNTGAVYVYLRDLGGNIDSWGQVAKLTGSDVDEGAQLGRSLDMTGDLAIVGAPGGRAAYVFSRTQGGADNWGEIRKLVADDANAYFGGYNSVGISGDLLTVSDSSAVGKGQAYIYAKPDDIVPPTVLNVDSSADTGDGQVTEEEISKAAINLLYLTMSEDMWDPFGSTQDTDVTNRSNYLLFGDGGDGFDTLNCASGINVNDTAVAVDSVAYDIGSDLVSVSINNTIPLSSGSYRLLMCGATTKDLAGNALDGNGDGISGDDFSRTFHIDRDPPNQPTSFDVTSHSLNTWSSNAQITMTWSGASDVGLAGLGGYSLGATTQALTPMDDTIEQSQSTDPHSWTSDPLPSGQTHYVHLRTCDTVGNCANTLHRGPFWIDVTPPTLPTSLTSSHNNNWSADNTVDVTWAGAIDEQSGMDGYSYLFTQTAEQPDHVKNMAHGTDPHTLSSPPLGDGIWFFRISSVDNVGNWSPLFLQDSYKIDTTAPVGPTNVSSSTHTVGATTDVRDITMNWTAAVDAGSGLLGYWHSFSENPVEACGESKNTWGASPVTSVSATLNNGTWYFHICAGDNIGHWAPVVDVGPYIVSGGADVEVTQSESMDPVQTSANLIYTVNIQNNGPLAAENVTLYDQLDQYVVLNSVTPSSGTCSPQFGEIYWTISCDFGTMNAGVSVSILIDVTVPSSSGTIQNYASGSTTTEDGNNGNNSSTENTIIQNCNEPLALPGANQTIDIEQNALLGENPPASGGLAPYSAQWSLTPVTGAELDDATLLNPTFSATALGNYNAKLVITDAASCVSQAASTLVSVTELPDLFLSNKDIAQDKTIERCRTITAEQVRIVAPHHVVFRAGTTINLGVEFVVEEGATFSVEIDPSLTCP